jgi:hypothetical protein
MAMCRERSADDLPLASIAMQDMLSRYMITGPILYPCAVRNYLECSPWFAEFDAATSSPSILLVTTMSCFEDVAPRMTPYETFHLCALHRMRPQTTSPPYRAPPVSARLRDPGYTGYNGPVGEVSPRLVLCTVSPSLQGVKPWAGTPIEFA